MERMNLPATKSNLIHLREELDFAREGLDLLDQKKEILINQISFLVSKVDRVRNKVNADLMTAYGHLKEALIEHGESAVESAGLGVRAGENLSIHERSLMGVVLPMVSIELPPVKPQYGLYGTGKAMDDTAGAVHDAMESIAELAELEVGIERVLAELRKTLKRINALSHIYVPMYSATVRRMEETLEEKEREALFQMKRIRGSRKDGML